MALTPQAETILTSAIRLPEFNVFAVQFGDFGIRWYALAYIAGLVIGLVLLKRGTRAVDSPVTSDNIDSLLNYLLVGLVLGGRFGYVLFYNARYFITDPLAIFRVWEGGMSFHGALIGICLALWLMASRHNLPLLTLGIGLLWLPHRPLLWPFGQFHQWRIIWPRHQCVMGDDFSP